MKPFRLLLAQIVCRRLPPIVAQSVRTFIYPLEQARKDDVEFLVRAQTGSRLKNRTSDYHGYNFSVHGYYDWRRWSIGLAVCSAGDSILEIGSNIGTETVGFADIVGPSGKVYAFEPLPSNVAALRETCSLNRLSNIEIYPVAVGNRCERVRFSVPSRLSSGTGSVRWNGDGQSETVDVECLTLDSLFTTHPSIKMIFIDAEGGEVRILQGAAKLIEHRKPAIVLEADSAALELAGHSLSELWQTIHSFGYEAFNISRLGLIPVSAVERETVAHGNWFCVHRSNVSAVERAGRSIRTCALMPCFRGLNPLTRRAA